MAEFKVEHKKQQSSEHGTVSQRKGETVLPDNRGQVSQARALTDNRTAQLSSDITAKPNNTGLPNQLKVGIESLSGMSMDHVKVHYNSSQPAQLNAHAYAQGSNIHVAPGQEKHLPHEAWHVVQQAQGRVKPTMQMKQGVSLNNDKSLEREADIMGARGASVGAQQKTLSPLNTRNVHPIQRYVAKDGFKISEDALYATKDSEKTKLWVSKVKGATGPAPDKFFKKMSSDALWDTYSPKVDFTKPVHDATGTYQGGNDCGYYAGALAAGNSDWRHGVSMGEFRDKTSGKDLGQGSQGHTANLTNKQYDADPDIGEAYFIWPKDASVNRFAVHHVSTVVARDKNDRVTSEADCSDARTHPHFEMFGTVTLEQTFLGKNWHYFTSNEALALGYTDAQVAVLHRPKPPVPPPLVHAPLPLVHTPPTLVGDGSVSIDIEAGLGTSGSEATGVESAKSLWNLFGLL